MINAAVRREARTILRVAARWRRPAAPLSPTNWGLSSNASRGLTLDGIVLHDLLARWGSPLHVVNGRRLRDNARRFLSVPNGTATGCNVFFSYKTNPIPGVLSILHASGLGAEVVSPYELWLARRLGVPNHKIIYNGPAKSAESIRQAIKDDVRLLCVNHREELETIIAVARDLRKSPRVAIRIALQRGWAAQFGLTVEDGAALAAYGKAVGSNHLQVVGLQVHRGGMIRSEQELLEFIEATIAFTETLRRELNLEVEVLDLGGSLCPPTVKALSARDRRLNQALQRDLATPDISDALTVESYISLLTTRIDAHYRNHGRPPPQILLEPGRAVTSDAQFLLASVVSTKRAGGTTYAVLDAGINLAESVRSEYHQLLPVNRFGESSTRIHTIVGPICTPGDTLYSAIRLPELHMGDSLAIMDAGAYFIPFSTSFSFPRPAVLLIDDGREQLLRRAECFEDLIALDAKTDQNVELRSIL